MILISFLCFSLSTTQGTYIRSIAHDFGQLLGVGGHLIELRRVAIGPFTDRRAFTLAELEEKFGYEEPVFTGKQARHHNFKQRQKQKHKQGGGPVRGGSGGGGSSS